MGLSKSMEPKSLAADPTARRRATCGPKGVNLGFLKWGYPKVMDGLLMVNNGWMVMITMLDNWDPIWNHNWEAECVDDGTTVARQFPRRPVVI